MGLCIEDNVQSDWFIISPECFSINVQWMNRDGLHGRADDSIRTSSSIISSRITNWATSWAARESSQSVSRCSLLIPFQATSHVEREFQWTDNLVKNYSYHRWNPTYHHRSTWRNLELYAGFAVVLTGCLLKERSTIFWNSCPIICFQRWIKGGTSIATTWNSIAGQRNSQR